MATLHTKTIYVNSSATKVQNPNKTNLEQPVFYYKDIMSLNFFVVDTNNNPVNLSGATFALAIDSGFGAGKSLVRCDNSKFSVINATLGQIACKCSMDDVRVLTYLDGGTSQVAYVALWAIIGSVSYIIGQFQITIKNIIK